MNMKPLNQLIAVAITATSVLLMNSCSVTIPQYTTVDNLTKLNPGMTKQQTIATLDNLYPFDIMNGGSDVCEIHVYKYKHPKQENKNKTGDRATLRGGLEKFVDEGDAYVVYKNGAIYSVITDAGKVDFGSLMANMQEISNSCMDIKGCTDPYSLNYNEYATIDDGNCKYCDCGYMRNPNYNPDRPKSDCNQECIPVEDEDGCGACDLIDLAKQGKANVTLNLNMDNMPMKKSRTKNQDKTNNEDKSKNNTNNKKTTK
jgi:hypothetical protein